MKASCAWLSDYVALPDIATDEGLQAFCDKLDLTGTGVEDVERTGGFERVVTGCVLEKEPHPDSDHLWACKVDVGSWATDEDGNPRPLSIVCGAQNFNAGDHIVVALVGAKLPGDFEIKKSKLRGVLSEGMNCSARELGIGDDHSGILILPSDAPVGVPFGEYAGSSDVELDLEITPNRPDCLSMIGLAREIGAMYDHDATDPVIETAQSMEVVADQGYIDDLADVTVDDPARCPRYTARVIRGVKIGPSPDWLVQRLASIGQRSINNIVDITNYVLYWCGQPLHAFDLGKLQSPDGKAHIIVRAAHDGEELMTLDGQMRTLSSDMTVIATPERSVALAGVMGGLETEITDETTDILLEAATFEPGRTSRTSRNLGLMSESSLRYERGVDDHDIAERSAAAAALMVEVAGGSVCAAHDNEVGIIDVWPLVSSMEPLTFRVPRFNAMIGAEVPVSFIANKLSRLGCEVSDGCDADTLTVLPPTYRRDLEREIDLYEEVLRLWGMDAVPSTLPESSHRFGRRTPAEKIRETIDATLRASGLSETMTYSFAAPGEIEMLRLPVAEGQLPVELINPLSAEQSQMRQTLLPGLLHSVAYNQNRGVASIKLYEIGTVFTTREGRKTPKESKRIACVMAGERTEGTWYEKPSAVDFFDAKGVLENLCDKLGFEKVRFKALSAEEAPHLQPGRAAAFLSGGIQIGWVGEIHPEVVRAFDATPPVAAFELEESAIFKAARELGRTVNAPSAYPSVNLDVAFVVDEDVTNERLVQVITSAGGKHLESVRLFDIYRDEQRLGANKKSLAYALTLRADDRTLTGEEAESVLNKVMTKVAKATGAEVRSA